MNSRKQQLSGQANTSFACVATLDSRYSFTNQFVEAAKFFSEQAEKIEKQAIITVIDQCQHRAYVTAAIMQSVAVLESDSFELINYGPYRKTQGMDLENKEILKYLAPISLVIDKLKPVEKFEVTLHLLKKPPISNQELLIETRLLVSLRNEIVHYKSILESKRDRTKLMKQLISKRFTMPSFVSTTHSIFPHQILGADCAKWAILTVQLFLELFYKQMGPIREET